MNRKYFFFDIDGTLVVGIEGGTYVPESAKRTIKELEAKGHFVAIATGRSYAMAKSTMEELGFHHMVSDGGNGITIDDKLLGIEPLDYDLCVELINECKQKNMIWSFSPEVSNQRLAPDSRFMDFTHDDYLQTIEIEGLNPLDYDKIYKCYIACYPGEEEKLDTLKKLPWCRFHGDYIFVEPGDKSAGIKRIVDHFGGSYEDVVVFGDQKNDLSMFRDEWLSIAMGNAIDDLKEKASFVTKDVDDDGIYYACKHFGWID